MISVVPSLSFIVVQNAPRLRSRGDFPVIPPPRPQSRGVLSNPAVKFGITEFRTRTRRLRISSRSRRESSIARCPEFSAAAGLIGVWRPKSVRFRFGGRFFSGRRGVRRIRIEGRRSVGRKRPTSTINCISASLTPGSLPCLLEMCCISRLASLPFRRAKLNESSMRSQTAHERPAARASLRPCSTYSIASSRFLSGLGQRDVGGLAVFGILEAGPAR